MTEKAKVYALRTFTGKADKTKQYYTAECLLDAQNTTPNFKGQNAVTVFMEREHYDILSISFKPLMPVDLNVSLMGNRVSYSVA